MTKPISCRIVESRPLETAEQPQQEYSDPYPVQSRTLTVWHRQQRPGAFHPRRYPSEKRMGTTAPKGIWIDLFA